MPMTQVKAVLDCQGQYGITFMFLLSSMHAICTQDCPTLVWSNCWVPHLSYWVLQGKGETEKLGDSWVYGGPVVYKTNHIQGHHGVLVGIPENMAGYITFGWCVSSVSDQKKFLVLPGTLSNNTLVSQILRFLLCHSPLYSKQRLNDATCRPAEVPYRPLQYTNFWIAHRTLSVESRMYIIWFIYVDKA